jgi:hypothetical protein
MPYLGIAGRLSAAIVCSEHEPPGYEDTRRDLAERFHAPSRMPSPSELADDLAYLRDLLEDACFPEFGFVGGDTGDALIAALVLIHDAYWEAARNNLIADTAEQRDEWRRRRPSPEQGEVRILPVVADRDLGAEARSDGT